MSKREAPARGLRAEAPLRSALRAPASKSIAQRALVCAGLAQGGTRLAGLGLEGARGEDVRAAAALVAVRGARLTPEGPDGLALEGCPPERTRAPEAALVLGESGTLARFALAAAGLAAPAGTITRLEALGSLARRGSPALTASLVAAGVVLQGDGWPRSVCAAPAPDVVRLERPSSSQEVSALLTALAAHPGARRLEVRGPIPSRPYVELTRRVLAAFGIDVTVTAVPAGSDFELRGPLRPPAQPYEVEPDASLSAVALAAGCLSDGEVTALGLGPASAQGDVRVLEHLAAFGCRTQARAEGLRAAGRPTRGARLDLSGEPDLAPVLAVLAADAARRGAASTLVGLETLPGKESSRIEVLARGLSAAGWKVVADARSLHIEPSSVPDSGELTLDPAGDHRMAFAFALLGLVRPGVRVANPACVAKSWPGFWRALDGLGVRVYDG